MNADNRFFKKQVDNFYANFLFIEIQY